MKIKTLHIFFILLVIIITLNISACQKGSVIVDGYLYYYCSSKPYANKTINIIESGIYGYSTTTSTNSDGYFNVKMKKKGHESWFIDWNGQNNSFYEIEFCAPYGCDNDTHLKYYILPPAKNTIVKLEFNFDSTYNSSKYFSWSTDSLYSQLNVVYGFSSGSISGPFNSSFNTILLDSISTNGYYNIFPDAIIHRKLNWTFKNNKHGKSFSYSLCNTDTTKILINVN